MFNDSSNFCWQEFNDLAVELSKSNKEVKLRTAIGRFYYASFCQARDYLINNKIFYNNDLKSQMCSQTSVVHKATINIYKYETKLKFSI